MACSDKTGHSNYNKNSFLSHFNLPLSVESLDIKSRAEYRKKAEDFYRNYSSKDNFAEQFEKVELEQFKNDQIIFLDGMAVTHLMAGFILKAKSL